MLLRPATYSGEEIEVEVHFDDAMLFRADYNESTAVDMKPGDTVSVCTKVYFKDTAAYEYISLYISEQNLTEFISCFGFKNITAIVNMKVEFIYAIHDGGELCLVNQKEEIIACKLLEILSYQDEKSTDERNMLPEIRDYFADGMK